MSSVWVHRSAAFRPKSPLLMFDLDSTLRPYRGKGPPIDHTARVLAHLAPKYNIAVFSNAPVANPQRSFDAAHEYLQALHGHGGDCDILIATRDDRCRKPMRGMWDLFREMRGQEGVLPLLPIFYCGDAAGRAGDFSASDRNFANNIGVPFAVPEQVFRCAFPRARRLSLWDAAPPKAPKWCEVDALLDEAGAPDRRAEYDAAVAKLAACPVVLMMGSPGSGKSHLAREIAKKGGHAVVSQDDHGARALGIAAKVVGPVVLDATHRTRANREASRRRLGADAVVAWLRTPKQLCFHLDGLRCDGAGAVTKPKRLPAVAIHSYWKRHEPTQSTEKVVEIAGPALEDLGLRYH